MLLSCVLNLRINKALSAQYAHSIFLNFNLSMEIVRINFLFQLSIIMVGEVRMGRKTLKIVETMKIACSQIKKTLWLVFYITGSYVTFSNVWQNFSKYSSFESVMMERHSELSMKFFPKVVICFNSMHSKEKGHGQV